MGFCSAEGLDHESAPVELVPFFDRNPQLKMDCSADLPDFKPRQAVRIRLEAVHGAAHLLLFDTENIKELPGLQQKDSE